MASYSYVGQRYKQGASQLELISFCASANDIHAWGGVPAKTERFHGGFQRALSERFKKIKAFFDDGQASPTSIVVAFREGVLKVSPLGYPASWATRSGLSLEPEFVHVEFNTTVVDEDDISLDQLRARVAQLLKPRLDLSAQQAEEASTEGDDEEEGNDEAADAELSGAEVIDEADGGDGGDNESEESDSELDVGHSTLRQFYEFISDPSRIAQWLEEENARYSVAKSKTKKSAKETEYTKFTPEELLKYLLLSLLRPAMIVDGQHRVWGAYNSDNQPIAFSVCAIKDADWIEQVFQFVVLNKLAKPISPSFLTSILNTSLTNAEVKGIESRLERIGIRNTERIIVKYLNHEPASPFFGLIAEPTELAGISNEGKLSDKGMIRLAKRWRNVTRSKKELEMFLPAIGQKGVSAGRKAWGEYATWTKFFFSFWNVLKKRYQKDGIWEKKPGFHLLYIVTMHALQDAFLEAKSKGDSSFKDLDDFEQQVDKYFEDVPATFFQGWEMTGLQSGEGPLWIKKAVDMLRSGKRLATVREESELFHSL